MAIRERAWVGAHLYTTNAWYCGNQLSSARAELRAALRRDPDMILRSPFWRVLLRALLATLASGPRFAPLSACPTRLAKGEFGPQPLYARAAERRSTGMWWHNAMNTRYWMYSFGG